MIDAQSTRVVEEISKDGLRNTEFLLLRSARMVFYVSTVFLDRRVYRLSNWVTHRKRSGQANQRNHCLLTGSIRKG